MPATGPLRELLLLRGMLLPQIPNNLTNLSQALGQISSWAVKFPWLFITFPSTLSDFFFHRGYSPFKYNALLIYMVYCLLPPSPPTKLYTPWGSGIFALLVHSLSPAPMTVSGT